MNEYNKNYYQKNKERLDKYSREYYKNNKERFKKYRNKNKEYSRRYLKDYYKNNKEKILRASKKWYKRNPNYHKEYRNRPYVKMKRRIKYKIIQRKRLLRDYKLTNEEYKTLSKKCYLCGFCKYRVDIHHIDENKKNNNINNLIGLCPNCHLGIHRGKYKVKEEELKAISPFI